MNCKDLISNNSVAQSDGMQTKEGGFMKKKMSGITGILACLALLSASSGMAAELLDVKPNVAAGSVSVEVTADIPMTYTYYKVPGEARAVVDIADADPEKVEPLIVVNKGAVSSISVDKAMISSMTVSRLVFNLVAETDIHVVAAADRKKLTVSFGKGGEAATPAKPVAAVAAETIAPSPSLAISAVTTTPPVVNGVVPAEQGKQDKEEDPFGLDEPQSAAAAPKASAAVPQVATSPTAAVAVPKLAPVVPSSKNSEPTVVTGVTIGNKSVDIVTKSEIGDYKTMTLDNPPRVVIDIPGVKGFPASSFPVKKFGIEKVRVATNGANVRVVLDSRSTKNPVDKIVKRANGLQIQF